MKLYSNNSRKTSFFSLLSANTIFIIVNVVIFILFSIASLIFGSEFLYDYLAIKPTNFMAGKYFWTIFTSMFMHANFFHLFVNMISLLFVGKFLETIIGRKRYVWFYLISGIFAGLFFAALSYFFGAGDLGARIFGSPEIYAVGASGAIFAIAGVLSFLTPNKKVSLIAGPIIAIVLQAIFIQFVSNSVLLGILDALITIYIFVCIFAMFSFNSKMRAVAIPLDMKFWLLPIVAIIPLFVIGFFVELPIGNTAHLGGYIAGLVYGIYLKKKYKNKVNFVRKYFN